MANEPNLNRTCKVSYNISDDIQLTFHRYLEIFFLVFLSGHKNVYLGILSEFELCDFIKEKKDLKRIPLKSPYSLLEINFQQCTVEYSNCYGFKLKDQFENCTIKGIAEYYE